MEKLLTTYQIPGGALAVSNKGALIYARGFGYADTARSTPVQPDSRPARLPVPNGQREQDVYCGRSAQID
jgi:CubicO group peptidase (beta-lactamase class C family)